MKPNKEGVYKEEEREIERNNAHKPIKSLRTIMNVQCICLTYHETEATEPMLTKPYGYEREKKKKGRKVGRR